MVTDFLNAGLLGLIILLVGVISEFLASRAIISHEVSRKLLHISAGVVISFTPIMISCPKLLLAIGILLIGTLYAAVRFNLFPDSIDGHQRKSWGIVYFPIAYSALTVLFGFSNPYILSITFLIVAFSDSSAAIIGKKFGKQTYLLSGDTKSILGSVTFFVVTVVILSGLYLFEPIRDMFRVPSLFLGLNLYFVSAVFVVALLLTILEAISGGGSDNLTVPIAGSFYLFFLMHTVNDSTLNVFMVSALFAAIVCFISFKVKFLDASGALAAFILATILFGVGTWQWAAPILAFFVLSSLLGRYRRTRNAAVDEKFSKSNTRDAKQVFANGGIPALIMIVATVTAQDWLYPVYLVALAAATADTWGTEIGTLVGGKTVSVIGFKEAAVGQSGGISFAGTFGGIVGAAIIAGTGWYWINGIEFLAVVVIFGFVGSFFDSVLGATVQERLKCAVCSLETERTVHCGQKTIYVKGIQGFDNDFVNVLSIIVAASISAVYIYLAM